MNQHSQHVNIFIIQPQNSVANLCNCTINQAPQSIIGFLESVHDLELQIQHSISQNGSSSPDTNTKTRSSLHMQRLTVSTNCVPFGILGYAQQSRQPATDRSLDSAVTGLILCSDRLISFPKTSTTALGPIQSPTQRLLTAGSFPAG